MDEKKICRAQRRSFHNTLILKEGNESEIKRYPRNKKCKYVARKIKGLRSEPKMVEKSDKKAQ